MKARRALARLAVATVALFGGLAVLAAPAASAHPLGNFTVNRFSGLALTPGRIGITWVLDMAEIPTEQERASVDSDGDGRISGPEARRWADRTTEEVRRSISLTVDGRTVGLRATCDVLSFHQGQAGLPILRLVAGFTGSIPPAGQLDYRDGNYADRVGWQEVAASGMGGVTVTGSNVPASSVSDELRRYPTSLLASPLRQTSASVSYAGPAGDSGTAVPAPGCGSRSVGSPAATGGSFAALVRRPLTPAVLAVSLLLAFAFGAVHAIGPGHGKTITAAYLVGKGARIRQAVAAGIAVSFMHTISVLALGLVALVLFHSFPAERVYPWLGVVTGLVALGLGTFLMTVRIRARRRGLDPWDGDGHGHHHDHHAGHQAGDGPEQRDGRSHHYGSTSAISRRGLAALAVSGGLLPSPTALVVLTGAIAYHRIGYGLGLIVAFSLGLAAALVAIALVAIRARTVVSKRLGARVGEALPILSAAVILGFGLFFLVRGAVQI